VSRNLVELIRRHHTVEAPTALEKEGTFINAERRFQVVEPAIDPPGEARTDFEIIGEVSRRLGQEMGWRDPWDALDEIARPYRVSVRSRVGRIEVEAKVTDRIEPGHVFTSFHLPETRTNLLVGQSADVNTSCPEYKVIAVDVRPISEESSFVPVLADVG
jgi:predicted molibdopterin-dependent oxidoreductase YjgC